MPGWYRPSCLYLSIRVSIHKSFGFHWVTNEKETSTTGIFVRRTNQSSVQIQTLDTIMVNKANMKQDDKQQHTDPKLWVKGYTCLLFEWCWNHDETQNLQIWEEYPHIGNLLCTTSLIVIKESYPVYPYNNISLAFLAAMVTYRPNEFAHPNAEPG